jgi:1,4-dihydroxy-2-naphthoyl-CoA hydrolase
MTSGAPDIWDPARLPVPAIDPARTFEGILDLEWLECSEQLTRVRFRARDELKQPLGLLHGGIYSAVAETMASLATIQSVWRDGRTASGLSNSASFLRPVTGGTVHVTGNCRHRNELEWLWSHEFRDDQDRLCALVDVRIAVRPLPRAAA